MKRTELAEAVLVEYHRLKREPLDCLETSIIDLITDLMHLACRENLNALALSRMAQNHFEVETGEESDALVEERQISTE